MNHLLNASEPLDICNLMDTIFALSSGKGKSGVAVIRISGREALSCLKKLGVEKNLSPRTAHLLKLKEGENLIDNALCIYFDAPKSFTGEDVVELHLHGSIAVIRKVSEILYNIKNVRPADAGEFSKRAFENGKMDLLQAEGLADLIHAETEAQLRQANKIIAGDASKIYDNWREKIIEIIAFIEAFVDFPEEDIPTDLDKQAQQKIVNLISEIENFLQDNRAERLKNGAVATILGNPNVGKSTLINFLSKRDIAIVSEIAGTTRDAIESNLEIKGFPLTIIDTAGIRNSTDAIEQEGIKRALEKAEKSDFKIIILSAEEYPNFDSKITDLIDEKTILIINKSDIFSLDKNIKIKNIQPIICSIKNHINCEEIIEKIVHQLESILHQENPVITRARHRKSLEECKNYLQEFLTSRTQQKPIEISAEALRISASNLGKITGKIDVEMILDKIFSEFCIGK
ncbi:MAG: tRNA uridine-5-carboxymethylaminomethyl(34) synthesis GTPase MnmE [Rickettsiales bacterium]|nr:tRNA uridine-5-carboxymethylaminomethyl(34) synthesis GTPase MnmE [Rickettsiales bacterium]